MNIQFGFEGKNAVVTGGAQGIGFEIARAFLAAGARVSVWDSSSEALGAAKDELSAWSGRAHFERVDVGVHGECLAAASALPFPAHILVNNAGITSDRTLAKMQPGDFERVLAVNLTGTFNVTKALLPRFDDGSRSKRIINMSSVVALYGNYGQTNYAAAKAGVIAMTRTWARELAKSGFTCNAIAPGFTLTRMVRAMPEEAIARVAQKVPVGRLGRTEDIASACLFLASDEAGYVNGAVLSVDGGLVS